MIGFLNMKLPKYISALVLSVLLLSALASTSEGQTSATGQRLIAGMIEALGGKAFLDVREIQVQGSFYSFRRDELQGLDVYVDYIRLPDKERTEFGASREKKIHINNGDMGWIVTGRDGKDVQPQSERETEEFLMNMRTSFDYVTRFVLNTPESTTLATGSEMVDSRRADMVEIRDAEKNLIRFLIDRDTRLPLKMQVRRAGESILFEEVYANWHRFDGVMTSLFVIRYRDGMKTMEMRPEKVAYNPGFADSLFSPPASR